MPTDVQKQNVADALEQIRQAEMTLDDLIANTSGTGNLRAISSVYDDLNSAAAKLIRAQTITDDNIFDQVITNLKVQAKALETSEDSIRKIVTDMTIAGKVLGYIAQAVTIILTKL